MQLPYPEEWSPRQRRQKILLDGPLTPRWLPQVEDERCSIVEVFSLGKDAKDRIPRDS